MLHSLPRRAPILMLGLCLPILGVAADPLVGPGNEIAKQLPKPYATESARKNSRVIGWPAGRTPQAPDGFAVTAYARDFDNPRWLYVLENGDVLVAEARTRPRERRQNDPTGGNGPGDVSADRITLLRDADKDGVPELRTTFLADLNQPFGMLQLGDRFYVANTDGVWVYPYKTGETSIRAEGERILSLPAGGYNNHWTRNIVARPDGKKLYVTVGSAGNNGEEGMEVERRRANILEINPDGSGERVFASGIRNPNGIDFKDGVLWTAVNERDDLGDNLVPDYITSVRDGGFYGWPYAYFGPIEDPRMTGQAPDLVKRSIVPDYSVGPHVAAMDITFNEGDGFPAQYRGGAFVGLHGSWNRAQFTGYKVLYVPFKGAQPAGAAQDFLTGFIADADKGDVYGRPVASVVLPDGSLLVSDDSGNTLWRVAYTGR